jgi:hypothetical protein
MKSQIKLISDNAAPAKPPKVRRAPKVKPYCPACGSCTWTWVNQGPADLLEGAKPLRRRGCWECKHVWG